MENQLIVSIFELSLSIIIGVLCFYLTHYVIIKIYSKKTVEENPYKNMAFLIFLSGILFSIGYLLSGIMTPLSSTLDMLNNGQDSILHTLLSFTKYIIIFSSLGLLLGGLINFITYFIFSSLTNKLNELDEIRNGNVGVAILVSVIAIIMALFCKEPFLIVLEYFIPYPEFPIIN
tara:strand:- start:345 stop:869 length:525 start_codon:yes stop_codon:yes gene_type:complete